MRAEDGMLYLEQAAGTYPVNPVHLVDPDTAVTV